MRLKILRVIIAFLFGGLALGLVYHQVLKGFYFYKLSKNNRIRVVHQEARRGRIFDRNGVILADNRLSFDVMVIDQEIKRKEDLFSFLSKSLGEEKKTLLERFQRRMLTPFAPVVVARNIDREKAIVIEENKFRFPGLFIQVGSKRYYPFKEANAHGVGYVGKLTRSKLNELKDYGYTVHSLAGKSGIEEFYDSYLKGEDGGVQIEVNHRGQQVRLLGLKNPVRGQDIVLTIDNRIQIMATELLKEKKGAIVVMELESGDILGMVSSPSFDPNLFVDKSPKISEIFSDPRALLVNRAISSKFPPGSVFKLVMSVAGLETQKISPSTSFNCPGYYKLGRRRFQCTHSHGIQNLTEAIAHSCNVYFYNMGLLLEPEVIVRYAKMFGLESLTNIDLPYEVKGRLPEKQKFQKRHQRSWSQGDTLNLSIGQGDIQVTPLQVVRMMALIANRGREVQAHLLMKIGGSMVQRELHQRQIPVSEQTFKKVQSGLQAAVRDYAGTAHLLDIKNLSVYGKTGTAQSSKNKPAHSWLVGYCPTAKTKIVFCIFLEHGGSSYHACQIARQLLLNMQAENIL